MKFWERIVGKKTPPEVAEPTETIETLDQKIANLNGERKHLLDKLELLHSEGAWVSEKSSPRLKQIDEQLKDLNDKRNALWEKQRREGEKTAE